MQFFLCQSAEEKVSVCLRESTVKLFKINNLTVSKEHAGKRSSGNFEGEKRKIVCIMEKDTNI